MARLSRAPHTRAVPFTITAVPVPTGPEERSALIDAQTEMWRRWHLNLYGHDDLNDGAAATALAYAFQQYKRKLMLVAQRIAGGPVVGSAYLWFPTADNLTSAQFDLGVDPEVAIEEVGDALWERSIGAIREAGRTVVQTWTSHAHPAPGSPVLHAPGSGAPVPDDAVTKAYRRWGFTLEQAEQHSTLSVADTGSRWSAMLAPLATGPYQARTWVGSTPEDLVEGMARLRSRMSVDAPSAELEMEEEVWDAERVRAADQISQRSGRTQLTTVAIHRASGAPVAYTQLDCPAEHPEVAYQQDTLVHGDHRGHRLGALVKVHNARALANHAPGVCRVHTWNAVENSHMLAINTAMGFVPASVSASWQQRLA